MWIAHLNLSGGPVSFCNIVTIYQSWSEFVWKFFLGRESSGNFAWAKRVKFAWEREYFIVIYQTRKTVTLFPNKELKIWSIVQYLWCHKLQACLEMSSNTVSNKTKTNMKMEILNRKNLMLIKSRYLKTVTAMIFFVKTCRVLMSLTKYGTLPAIYSEWSRPRSSETLNCVDCDARDNFHKK